MNRKRPALDRQRLTIALRTKLPHRTIAQNFAESSRRDGIKSARYGFVTATLPERATRTKVAIMRQEARMVPRKLPATFEVPPDRQR